MSDEVQNINNIIAFWKDSSEKDYRTMQNLLNSGDYNWAMFLGHLMIEKLLKALFGKKQRKHPIHSHDLLRLAVIAKLEMKPEKEEWLDRLTTFNLNARYDNYKQDFYKLCTEEFANEWSKRIEILRKWLLNQL